MGERTRWYSHAMLCENCKSTFYASRYDARFCGASCRAQYNRNEKRRAALKERTTDAIGAYLRAQDTTEDYERAIHELIDYLSKQSFIVDNSFASDVTE